MDDEFQCAICLDIAENAVETTCCAHIFCESCIMALKVCPQCRALPLAFKPSILARRIIGNMKVECPLEGCKQMVPRSNLKDHKENCEFKLYKCMIPKCNFEGLKIYLIRHISAVHADEMVASLFKFYKPGNEKKPNDDLDRRIEKQMNRDGRWARLGITGKYYCGGILLHSCCCNGRCGPTNGCNCTSCMALDIKSRKLPKNWLVNRDGSSCRKGSTGLFYCGRKINIPRTDGYCGPTDGANCGACNQLDSQQQRYAKSSQLAGYNEC